MNNLTRKQDKSQVKKTKWIKHSVSYQQSDLKKINFLKKKKHSTSISQIFRVAINELYDLETSK